MSDDQAATAVLDCPACEVCCAIGLCCPPASEEQRVALAAQIIKDGKWTDTALARQIADAIVDAYHAKTTKRQHAALQRKIAKLVAAAPVQ